MHGGTNVVDHLVNHLIEADIDFLFLRQLPCPLVRRDIEANDDRARGVGEPDIVLVDRSNAGVKDLDFHFFRREGFQGIS